MRLVPGCQNEQKRNGSVGEVQGRTNKTSKVVLVLLEAHQLDTVLAKIYREAQASEQCCTASSRKELK